VLGAILLCSGNAGAQNTKSAPSDYAIKAGFIYNFAKLVEWPKSSWENRDAPMLIGVLGNDRFADVLERAVSGKRIAGRPFAVRRLKWPDINGRDCQILFIASEERAQADDIVHLFRKHPVLTIAEWEGFAKRGGIINFTERDSRVHFEVNADAGRQASLTISSRLLSLAKIVQTSSAAR